MTNENNVDIVYVNPNPLNRYCSPCAVCGLTLAGGVIGVSLYLILNNGGCDGTMVAGVCQHDSNESLLV